MINLLLKERRNTSSWCIPCIKHDPELDLEVCDKCKGFLVTYFRCPSCDAVDYYRGYDNPKECDRCGILFPDFGELVESELSRVAYSLEELPL